jgi:hypothetical protein
LWIASDQAATFPDFPVQIMLDRKWSPERVRKALGGNFLHAVGLLRP